MSEAANDEALSVEEAKAKFLESLKVELGSVDLPKVCGWQLFIRIHQRENKSLDFGDSKKFEVLDKSLTYDKYTRNVGQVLAMGQRAYKGEKYEGCEPYCKVGDWITFTKGAGTENMYGGIPVRTMNDDKCLMVIADPNYITE